MKSLILCAMLALCASCSMFSPQERNAIRATIQQEYEAGNITAAQRDVAIEAIDRDEPVDWEGLGIGAINIALAALGAAGVVRIQRGPPTQRVGLPQTKVHA